MSQFITLEQAKTLRAIGYDKHTDYSIYEYVEDCIVHDDPDDRESRKKGDVDVYQFTWKDLDNDYLYPYISQDEMLNYLRTAKNIHISVKCHGQNNWTYSITNIEETTSSTKDYTESFSSYEDCVDAAINNVLNELTKTK